jgi:hypothetical protein
MAGVSLYLIAHATQIAFFPTYFCYIYLLIS